MTEKPAIVRDLADLRILAQECKSICGRIDNKDRDILTEYRELGDRLIVAKELVGHGEYGKWLDKHGISKDRSSRAVKLSENWSKIRGPRNLEDAISQCDQIKLCSDPPPPITLASEDTDTSEDAESGADEEAEPVKPAGKRKPAPSSAAKPQPATPPAPTYPARVAPHFASAPLFKDIAQKAVRLGNLVQEAEASPAFKAVHQGQHVAYSGTLKVMASNFENDVPIQPCPDGCADNEPSLDSDPCKLCGGKGYQTQEDIDNAA